MKDYLPMGSVVLLKNAKRKLLITGRKQRRTDNNEIYDYVAYIYPIGSFDNNVYLFNEEDIETVVYRGYCDEEEEAFAKILNEQ